MNKLISRKCNTNKLDGTVGLVSHHVAKTKRSKQLNKDKTDRCEITDMLKKKNG